MFIKKYVVTGFCLVCYSTNLVGLRGNQFRTSLENCDSNYKSLLILQGENTLGLPENLNFSCYKVVTPSGSLKFCKKRVFTYFF